MKGLTEVLADLYPTEADARRKAADAGLNLALIPFDTVSLNRWHEILRVAALQDRIETIIAGARRDYPDNAALTEAVTAYRADSPASPAALAGRTEPLAALTYVFISYSHQDADYARKLAGSLEAQGLAAWLDERIDYGSRWPHVIQEKVDGCGALVVVMTPRSYESDWVQNELNRAKRKGKTVLPLLLEGDVWLSVEATQWVDVRHGRLPPASFYARVAGVVAIPKASSDPITVQKAPPDLIIRQEAPSDLITIDEPIRLELIRIPAGEFLMGSDKKRDRQAYDDELPQHRVNLSEFYIGRTPVTNAQYAAFKKRDFPAGKAAHPVINVPRPDAVAFCEWLTEQLQGVERTPAPLAALLRGRGPDGRTWRVTLPSETEWEKAARGGLQIPASPAVPSVGAGLAPALAPALAMQPNPNPQRRYPWGDDFEKNRCNSQEAGVGGTTPVGAYSPQGDSPYGVVDLSGNVWEWTSSLYKGYPYNPADGRENPQDAGSRVVRGGSWLSSFGIVRCACRYWYAPYNLLDYDGFRVVLSPL